MENEIKLSFMSDYRGNVMVLVLVMIMLMVMERIAMIKNEIASIYLYTNKVISFVNFVILMDLEWRSYKR